MQTINFIRINSDPGEVFRLASDVDRWPELLPHYRWVKTFWRHGSTSLVEMAARRGWIPVKWTSIQQRSEQDLSIHYKHVAGITEGMSVKWSIVPASDGVEVTIIHDLALVKRLVSSRFGKWIVGEMFVKSIADKTLKYIKIHAEMVKGPGSMGDELSAHRPLTIDH